MLVATSSDTSSGRIYIAQRTVRHGCRTIEHRQAHFDNRKVIPLDKSMIKHGRKTLRHSICTQVSLLQVYTSQMNSDYVSFLSISRLVLFNVKIEYTGIILNVLLAGSEFHQKDVP
jgi:hypothetical protein